MKLHENMIIAIYLRQNPEHKLEKENGCLLWFDTETSKYYWSNPNSKKFKGVYEAKGLRDWWQVYMNMEGLNRE